MTEKQKRFTEEYLIDLNATQAAIRAGYSPKNADKIGFAKITDVVDPKTVKIREDAAEEDLACIQSIKVKPNEFGMEREIKLYDKRAALVDLGKHLGMFKDKIELSGVLETEKNKLDDLIRQMRGDDG